MLDAEEYFHLAVHASVTGDHHACLMYLREVLHQEPRNAGAIYLLATVHAELGLVGRAIRGIEAVLAIDPRVTIARLQLAMLLLFETKRRGEARAHLTHVIASRDASLQAYAEALIAVVDDDVPRATEKLESVISQAKQDAPFTLLMKRLLDRVTNKQDTPCIEDWHR